ncbi:DUF262 domain-containing protein [Halovenus salina]|uniref:DUF262 domain-containing HNH endonuclease family protein n=1 Tax=Halovenus salina TaxID=1510225 RepID=A0ABD5W460_9EURY|nr:DUF262 domain-containing HNH endonuclease family protein [Halovenus salina]
MDTRTVHLDSLLTDGIFDIPSYQRSYSWTESQLQDFLEDLLYLPEGKSHFFGNIILNEQDDHHRTERGKRFVRYDVVDGQQRLTTSIVFLHVAAQRSDTVEEMLAEDNLLFPVTERPRLLPQDQDKEYFRDGLLGTAQIETETPSQDRLKQAFDYFEARLGELEDSTVLELANKLRYDCRVNVVEIDDQSEAASIFESLNDRGRPLSTLDKTKSFLMYMDDRSGDGTSLETVIKQRFGGIYRDLFVLKTGHERVNDFDEDSFLRFHWGMYDGYDSNEYFQSFETLKTRLREEYRSGNLSKVQEEINHYVQDLREGSAAFAAMFEPQNHPREVAEPLLRLLELGRMANILPILMASYLQFAEDDPDGFRQIIDACETLVFRMYAIDNRRSDTGRGRLVRLAHEIHTDSSLDSQAVVEKIDSVTDRYTPDERFERQLRDPDFYASNSSRDTKYLFYHYGQQIDSEADEEILRDIPHILSSEFQVEHILARKLPDESIPRELQDEFEDHVHRLGNLTLASRYWNNSYGNLPFSEKKCASGDREIDYESSALRVQRELADSEQFSKSEIEAREETLVKFALEEWAIDPPGVEKSQDEVPEDFVGYFPSDFFSRLTDKQEALLRALYNANRPLLTHEIIERIETEYGEVVDGSSGVSGILSGLSMKHTKEFRRSIMSARWSGEDNQYEFWLTLDEDQTDIFEEELAIN